MQHADEHRDEHPLFIVLSQLVVHAHGDVDRRHALGGQRTEQTGTLRHKQRGGHTLARHVADTEMEPVVLQHVTVEVAAHLPGRGHLGIHIESLVLGEMTGHHRHLDISGDAQLTLETLLGGGGILQLVDIADQRVLHIAKRLGQIADLVDTSLVGQVLVEMSRGDDPRLFGQLPQRFQLPRDNTADDIEHQQQSDDHNYADGSRQTVETAEDVIFRTDNRHAPLCFLQGFIEHETVLSVDRHLFHSRLTGMHGVTQGRRGRIRCLQRLGEDSLIEQFRGVGMYDKRTTPTGHDAIGMGIGLDGSDDIRQPTQRDVGRDDAHELPFLIL